MYKIDFKQFIVRASAILTNAYVAGTVIENVQAANQLLINVAFTKGSLTTGGIKVEFSNDGTNYFQETSEVFTAGAGVVSLAERTFAATGNYRIAIPIRDRYVRISAIGTGTVTDSLMAITAAVGTV